MVDLNSTPINVYQSGAKITTNSAFLSLNLGEYYGLGYSVSLDGDRLAVGAPTSSGDSGSNTGAVYIFKRTDTTWALEQKISDQSTRLYYIYCQEITLAYSVCIGWRSTGGWGSLWTIQVMMPPPHWRGLCFQTDRHNLGFGARDVGQPVVGLLVGRVQMIVSAGVFRWMEIDWLVGAYGDYEATNGGSDAGAVYVFKRTGTTWALEQGNLRPA